MGSKIIGRAEELALLEEYCNSEDAELIVVYGRRRIGKTFLVKEFFEKNFSFSSIALDEPTLAMQLKHFDKALRKQGFKDSSPSSSWFDAFDKLEKFLSSSNSPKNTKTGKRVVFLDEIPWMDTPHSHFMPAFEAFWNGWACDQDDLVVVVCGSTSSWILDKLVHASGGLYKRVTHTIHLRPFTLSECEEYIRYRKLGWGRKQIIDAYMIFGGVPYYYRQLSRKQSLAQNIDALFFDAGASLSYEFHDLLATLADRGAYEEILAFLSKKRVGYSRQDLEAADSLPNGGTLTNKLQNLERCGFIREFKRKTSRQMSSWFQICDPFIWFHFNVIEPGKVVSWLDYTTTQSYHTWSGYAFELICSLHVSQIKKALGIERVATTEYSPWYPPAEVEDKAQIDLVIERRDDWSNLCEMKYYASEFEISQAYAKVLLKKKASYEKTTKKGKVIRLTMVTANGVKHNKHFTDLDIEEITLDSLFE